MRTLIACLVLVCGCYGSSEFTETAPEADAGQVVSNSQYCECFEGPCCDGCLFFGADVKCVDDGMIGPATCTAPDRLRSPIGDRFCSGVSAQCDGIRVPNGAASIEGQCASVLAPGSCSETATPLGVTCSR